MMKKFTSKKSNKHEVTLISATQRPEPKLYQAKSATDPSSRVLVPAPPKGLPPPKPTNLDIKPVHTDHMPLASPTRPAPALPSPVKSPNPDVDRKLSHPPGKLHPVRPAPTLPPSNNTPASHKQTYTRSLTEPVNDLSKRSPRLRKTSSDKGREREDPESSKQEIINKLENKENTIPPPVKPKPGKKSENGLIGQPEETVNPIAFIDAGDGLRSSDSESLSSEKHVESKENIAPPAMRKSESSSSHEEPYGMHSGKGKNTTRPCSFPNNRSNSDAKKHKKTKSSSSFRRKRSPPTSPPPPPVSTPIDVNSLLGFSDPAPATQCEDVPVGISTPPLPTRQPFQSESPPTGPRCLVKHTHHSAGVDELTINKGEMVTLVQHVNNEWLYCSSRGSKGLVHRSNIHMVEDLPRHVPHVNVQVNRRMVARYNFAARTDKELELRMGDILVNCTKVADNWLYGERVTSRGLFPLNYAEHIK